MIAQAQRWVSSHSRGLTQMFSSPEPEAQPEVNLKGLQPMEQNRKNIHCLYTVNICIN